MLNNVIPIEEAIPPLQVSHESCRDPMRLSVFAGPLFIIAAPALEMSLSFSSSSSARKGRGLLGIGIIGLLRRIAFTISASRMLLRHNWRARAFHSSLDDERVSTDIGADER